MDISVIGASGGCGREIVTRLVRDGLLGRRELLAGDDRGRSQDGHLRALRAAGGVEKYGVFVNFAGGTWVMRPDFSAVKWDSTGPAAHAGGK